MTSPLALIALLAFGAACAAAGALWAARRRDDALHEAAAGRRALLELSDHWVWETDAAHALRGWRAPRGPAGAWDAALPLGAALWRLAAVAEPEAAPGGDAAPGSPGPLQRRMDAHAPIDDLRVTLGASGRTGAWRLSGVPRHDRRGRFLGYVGHARPVSCEESAHFTDAALARAWWQAGCALMLFRREAPGTPWRLMRASDEATRLIGRGDGGTPVDGAAEPAVGASPDAVPGIDWPAACAALPPAVARALPGLADGEARTVDGWLVSWTRVPADGDEDAGRLLALRALAAGDVAGVSAGTGTGTVAAAAAPAGAGASAPVPAEPAESAADHESFIYSVSHDLRAPIRVVEGFARILKEDYGRALDRIGNDHLERILAAAARMNHMIDALLALSRLQSQPLKRQPVDLSQLAAWIVDDLRGEQPERRVEVAIEPGLVVQGDPTLLRNAMENLLGNAWKYSARTAQARIAFRREAPAGRDGAPVFVVEDNGAGFDMRFADRLFGVFQRLHSAKDFHGTGVGLASVRRILRRHGGDIWAESEVDKGARFYFTLP